MTTVNPGPAVTDGSTVGGLGSPYTVGASASSLVSFYGVTPAVQPSGAAQAALTLTTGTTTNGAGFTTLTAFSAFVAQLENIRASLVTLGILKGSA